MFNKFEFKNLDTLVMERKSTALKAGRIKIKVFILQVQAFKIIVLRLKKKNLKFVSVSLL